MKKRTKFYCLVSGILSVFLIIAGCSSSGADPDQDLPPDPAAPTVISTVPVGSTSDVALNVTINATFSMAMDPATIIPANFTVAAGETPVSGTVGYNNANNTATFTAGSNLSTGTEYTATITTGAKNPAGKPLAAKVVWKFTTGTTVDTAAPTVVSTSPFHNATGVGTTGTVSAVFSEAMDTATINSANFTVAAGSTPVTGTVTYDVPNKTAIFAPASNLSYATLYTATVKTGVKDLAGNPLAANKVWTFTTASEGDGPAPVNLKTAGNFAILAKTAISTLPDSAITGDIGLSPAAESYMTGFSQTKNTGYSTSPQVTGFMYAADMTPPTPANMTTAISDMEAAYTDAAGRATPDFTNLAGGNIGGLVLTPGLYKWTTAVVIPANVTIQGGGGENDVWIFQIAEDLTLSNSVTVFLSNGARAKNVFWQVAGQVSLGTDSRFEGTILCQTAVTLGTNAAMTGRILAQSNVALNQAVVTISAP
jgi:hypothetical protein